MFDKIKDENMDYLFKCILSLETEEECYRFFGDLCSVAELKEMGKRMLAAKRLNENSVYASIVNETGLSSATISRVNRALKYGNDGYSLVLERMEKEDE
ncbi:MAG: TrpR-like protein, YerC/YecD [Ruminococcaceae bacterium]|nr:TrpR-like protein, YerC/YecD [Oscillospiraceae bacterium]